MDERLEELLVKLKEFFPNCSWDIEQKGRFVYGIKCNNILTTLEYCLFEDIFLPTFSEKEKSNMRLENLYGIINKIEKEGICFQNEN